MKIRITAYYSECKQKIESEKMMNAFNGVTRTFHIL